MCGAQVLDAHEARLPCETYRRRARGLAHVRGAAAPTLDATLAVSQGFAIPLAVERSPAIADPDRWLGRAPTVRVPASLTHAVSALAHSGCFGMSHREMNASLVALGCRR